MKFLLDECLSPRLVLLLSDGGHDVQHVSEIELEGKPDIEVMSWAKKHSQILISADTDFGELLAKNGDSLPSVILFRQGNRSPDHQAVVLHSNLEAVRADLLAGSFVVFSDTAIRIRKLPILGD